MVQEDNRSAALELLKDDDAEVQNNALGEIENPEAQRTVQVDREIRGCRGDSVYGVVNCGDPHLSLVEKILNAFGKNWYYLLKAARQNALSLLKLAPPAQTVERRACYLDATCDINVTTNLSAGYYKRASEPISAATT